MSFWVACRDPIVAVWSPWGQLRMGTSSLRTGSKAVRPTRPSSGFLATLAGTQTSLQCAGVAAPQRLLFLFSDPSTGHRAGAGAVAAALARRSPDAFQVELFDPMRDHTVLAGRLTALYGPITRRLPFLWGAAYHATNLQPTVRLFQHAIGRGLRRKLRAALDPRPALVASFHPLLNHVAVDVLPYGVPRVTVITDWINFHQAWTDLKADCIICPSQAAYDLCRRRGVPADRLVRAGLPIHPRFSEAIRRFTDKTAMRLRLRLRPHAPTVLLTGRGGGAEALRECAGAPGPSAA